MNLNYEGYENYFVGKIYKPKFIQYVFKFENGYGASVMRVYNANLWELAVITWKNNRTSYIDYDTELTDCILPYLTDEDVRNLLEEIKNL